MNEKPRILIVDDDDNTRKTLRMILGTKGYETTEAASGREARTVAGRQRPDLALLDVRLPDMLGVELLAPLKALDPDIVVIVVTGNASLDSAMQALNQGALAYFTKPLDMEALLTRITEALERQRLVRENRRLYQEAQRELVERKRAEEALRINEERLASFIQSATDGIVLYDSDLDLIEINKAALGIFPVGTTKENLIGKNILEIAPSLKESGRYDKYLNVVRTGESLFLSDLVPHPRFGQRHLTVKAFEVAKGLGIIFSDITQRKRAEEALRESKRRLEETLAELRETQEQVMHQQRLAAVGQLAAGIAHDFNNILASIVLYTQMSLRTSELSPTIRKRLEVIAREADRAADLVQQMLDFGRQAVLRRESLNLEPLLGKTVALLSRTLPENVRLDLALEPGDYVVNADPARVQQAIVNLALNARDAMPDGGELHIALSRVEGGEIDCVDCGRVVGGEWVQITVRDTGTGIAPEVLPHIFEPFFTTRAPLGHGLGLAQVYGIVKQHEGHLEVETEVGLGTTFRLYWPALLVAQPETQVRVQVDAAQGEGQTILVVEDNTMMRTALVDVMDMLGYRVLEAADGREALVVCEEHGADISLVLSDWVMPSMGGLALVRELEKRHMAYKVLMLTGHPLDYETKSAVPASVVGWLLKPVDLDELADAVAQALRESASAASAASA